MGGREGGGGEGEGGREGGGGGREGGREGGGALSLSMGTLLKKCCIIGERCILFKASPHLHMRETFVCIPLRTLSLLAYRKLPEEGHHTGNKDAAAVNILSSHCCIE